MNWKLVIQLSVFGLAMSVATVFLIPSNIEPLFWLVIFGICAYIIATQCPGRYFLHGLLVSLVNSVWITASHVLLFDRYIASHPQEAAMMTSMPLPGSPRLMMALVGPAIGMVSGLVLGLFAVVARNNGSFHEILPVGRMEGYCLEAVSLGVAADYIGKEIGSLINER